MDEFVQYYNYCSECIFLTTHLTRFLRVLKNCPCIHKTYSHFMDALKSQNIPWRRIIFYIFQKNQLKLYFCVRITLTHLLTCVYSIPLSLISLEAYCSLTSFIHSKLITIQRQFFIIRESE